MEIGEEQKPYVIEPLEDPVPREAPRPLEAPQPEVEPDLLPAARNLLTTSRRAWVSNLGPTGHVRTFELGQAAASA